MKKLAFLLTLFFSLTTTAKAVVPPRETWLTLNTAHFHVHHTPAQESYAKEFARYLEIALPKLQKDLGWTPITPIDVVINDSSDGANGFAMSFPKNQLEVYAVPFESDTTLMDYKNWVEELATHELTHIIANDTSLAAYKTLRSIFGTIAKPNGIQPVWMVEGLAVYEETANTDGGRGRSAITEALLRTAIRHGTLGEGSYISLDRLNDGVFWWPGGNTPYLVGYTVQSAANKDNQESARSVPGQLSSNNARNFVFMPNTSLEETTGKDWSASFAETIARLQKRYASSSTLDTENPAFCRLTQKGRFTGGQAISPDGQWIYFHLEDKDRGQSLARIPMPAPGTCPKVEPEVLSHLRMNGTAQVSVQADGKLVAFSAGDLTSAFHFFYDIYLYDVEKDKTRQLTHGKRAFDPTFVGVGEIAYVKNNGDNTQSIELSDLNGKNIQEIFHSKKFERIANLTSHNARIYFSLHNNNGQEEIVSVSRDGGTISKTVPLAEKGEIFFERMPFFDAEENLYFAANYRELEAGNKYHIYRMLKGSHTVERVLESSSGLLLRPVVVGKNHLLVNNYYLEGMDLAYVKFDTPASLPQKAVHEVDLHEYLSGQKAPVASTVPPLSPAETEEYDVLKTPATSLWPQYWLPIWEATLDGSYLGANTSGIDPLGQNSYSLTAFYDTRTNFPTYMAEYLNRTHPVNFHVFGRQYNDYFQATSSSNRVAIYGFETIVPYGYSAFSLGTAYRSRTFFASRTHSAFLFGNFVYSNAEKSPSAVDENRGQVFGTRLGLHPSTSFESEYLESFSEASAFFRGIHPTHSLGIRTHVGISTNSLLASNYFLGGGATPLSNTDFIVRGYPTDTLLGQKMVVANMQYTLPIAKPYRGWGTNPLFLKDIALRFHGDAGSATYLARYRGDTFLGYRNRSLGYHVITGTGLDTVFRGTLFYYFPVELVAGVHRGLQKDFGGTTFFYLAIQGGIFPYSIQHQ